MKVIPVIDILNGIVVHAIRGRRQEYQPLQSVLCKSVHPLEVATVFKTLGFSQLYIADLDAITGNKANYQLIKLIANETNLKLMVDAGLTNLKASAKMLKNGISKVVIGTETLQNKNFVRKAINRFGKEQVVTSLDLKDNKVLAKFGFADNIDPFSVLSDFKKMGVSSVIVLDVARVGSCEGVNVDFLKKVLEKKTFDIYVGGGVRDIDDLINLKTLALSGVLVASALHSGKISIEELRKAELL